MVTVLLCPWGSANEHLAVGSQKSCVWHEMRLLGWRQAASSRRGMAEDELIKITLFGERCPFKTAYLALVLHVSSKFQAKRANTIFYLRLTWIDEHFQMVPGR